MERISNYHTSGVINGIAFERFGNVWFALTDNEADAINMTMCTELIIAITSSVKGWKLSQESVANRLGITRPSLSDLLRGKINKFSLDTLTTLAHRAGLTVKMNV